MLVSKPNKGKLLAQWGKHQPPPIPGVSLTKRLRTSLGLLNPSSFCVSSEKIEETGNDVKPQFVSRAQAKERCEDSRKHSWLLMSPIVPSAAVTKIEK